MSEWKETILTDVCKNVVTGGTPLSSMKEYFENGDIPWLKTKEVNFNRITATENYISSKGLAKSSAKLIPVNSVIVAMYGQGDTAGRVAINKIPLSTNQACCNLIIDEKKADYNFIYYFLSNSYEELVLRKTGSAQPNLNTKLLKDFPVFLPPLPEQTAIASLLSSLDDKIDLLHRQNATLEKIAETLFRKWFVEEENEGTIAQVVTIQNGYAFKSKDFKEVGTNGVVKIKNISGGIIDIERTDFINGEVALTIQDRFKIKTGDILIAMTGAEIGKLGIIPKTNKHLWLNQRVGLLREKYKGAKYLAYLQLKSEFGQDYIENAATGSAQPNISGTGIESCGFPLLSEALIKKYSLQIGELYDKVIFNLGQIRTLTTLRDTLLPKLMSGEVRVIP